MSDVTDADREKAFRALGWHESWGLSDLNMEDRNEVEAIAAALAEERAKARAPFLAALEDYGSSFGAYGRSVADGILRAAEETL